MKSSEIQIYQGELLYPSETGQMKPVKDRGQALQYLTLLEQGCDRAILLQAASEFAAHERRMDSEALQLAGQALRSQDSTVQGLLQTVQSQNETIKSLAKTQSPRVVEVHNFSDWTGPFAAFCVCVTVLTIAVNGIIQSSNQYQPVQYQSQMVGGSHGSI